MAKNRVRYRTFSRHLDTLSIRYGPGPSAIYEMNYAPHTVEYMEDQIGPTNTVPKPIRPLYVFKNVLPGKCGFKIKDYYGFPGYATYTSWNINSFIYHSGSMRNALINWASSEATGLHELSFQKNNKFNLLVSLFELDDTIASFLNPRTLATYGGIQWGVLPLVSDLKSLYRSYKDIFDGGVGKALAGQTVRRVKNDAEGDLGGGVIYRGKFVAQGRLTFDTLPEIGDLGTALAIFADEIGFHPDFTTVWDAVPLSFLVDQFIPIGDVIDDMHPRGWFSPKLTFSGYISFKGMIECPAMPDTWLPRRTYFDYPPTKENLQPTTAELYVRLPFTLQSGSVNTAIFEEYKAPSAKDVFNAAYIAFLGRATGL